MVEQDSKILSTAPLVNTMDFSLDSKMTDIFLMVESKGYSARCFQIASSASEVQRERFQLNRGKNLDCDVSGVATCLPFAFRLMYVCEVGKSGDGEELLEIVVVLQKLLEWNTVWILLFSLGLLSWLNVTDGQVAQGGIDGVVRGSHGIGAFAGDPSLLDHHLALCQSSSFIGANISNTTECFKRIQTSHYDVSFNHSFGS